MQGTYRRRMKLSVWPAPENTAGERLEAGAQRPRSIDIACIVEQTTYGAAKICWHMRYAPIFQAALRKTRRRQTHKMTAHHHLNK